MVKNVSGTSHFSASSQSEHRMDPAVLALALCGGGSFIRMATRKTQESGAQSSFTLPPITPHNHP